MGFLLSNFGRVVPTTMLGLSYKKIFTIIIKITFSLFLVSVIYYGIDSSKVLRRYHEVILGITLLFTITAVWQFKLSNLTSRDIEIKVPYRFGKKIDYQDLYIMPWHKGYLRILNKEELNLLKENIDLESKRFLSYVSKIKLEEDLLGGFYFVLPKELCEHFKNRSSRVVENELGLMIN